MLSTSMKEALTFPHHINIPNCQPRVFFALLVYLYTGMMAWIVIESVFTSDANKLTPRFTETTSDAITLVPLTIPFWKHHFKWRVWWRLICCCESYCLLCVCCRLSSGWRGWCYKLVTARQPVRFASVRRTVFWFVSFRHPVIIMTHFPRHRLPSTSCYERERWDVITIRYMAWSPTVAWCLHGNVNKEWSIPHRSIHTIFDKMVRRKNEKSTKERWKYWNSWW
jgi:hypothetical protein